MPGPPARSRVGNVLVIGSGAAGLRAAIAATEAGSQVLVVGKRDRLDAHTVLAAGGINAVLGTRDPQDSWEQHFADTLREEIGPWLASGERHVLLCGPVGGPRGWVEAPLLRALG